MKLKLMTSLFVAACASPTGAFDKSMFDRTLPLPAEIKLAEPNIKETRKFLAAYNAAQETKKLYGPCLVVPGEAVYFRYTWPADAAAKDDPTKTVNQDYLRQNVFKFAGGDAGRKAELYLPSSTQIIVLTRPANPAAPAGDLVALSPLKSVIGFSKTMVQNRFCQPAKIEKTDDGKEAWSFFNAVTERVKTSKTTTSTLSGTIGSSDVFLNGSETTPITLSRTFVGWNFQIIFGANGIVESVVQGPIGPGEWKQVATP